MILFSLMPVYQTVQDGTEVNYSQHSALAILSPDKAGISDSQDVIVEKALRSIEEIYDMERYRFSLSPRWIPGSLQRVDGGQIRSVTPEGGIERYTNFTVSYMDRNQLRSAQIQLLVDTERKLPVANRRIPGGERIAENDLDMRWVNVPNDRGQLVDSVHDLDGKTVRRTLANGQPVRYADITSEYLVEAGDVIRLIFEQNGVRIEMEAEARQSGAQDEEIIIYNKDTRKRYVGRVSGPGIALWIRTQ
ncbi:flagella basal body P-ring formation protein FlgA [Rhodohalobacter sp. SW132]|uniref:flagellar basal body P-ring formation chaperone FlgA n=1 Tax=Rhodohalobacter sp. SW132 TaxID=2293433 RepID=UPI000E234969|nr:flagellar basal body P-ring formation chaperone FlgA [Rhodohalobacter sp. SW132]REL38655.1 flagella basal body P-ring formation protein FlgA [Rhodohalobacter sp. SW132]